MKNPEWFFSRVEVLQAAGNVLHRLCVCIHLARFLKDLSDVWNLCDRSYGNCLPNVMVA